MYVDPNKVILTDCDGVLFDWEYAFSCWMDRHGYEIVKPGEYMMDVKYGLERKEAKKLVRIFNESSAIRRLPPLRDAIHYVQKLHREHGFIFHAITSLSNDEYAQHMRTKNLREMFGDTVFEKYVYLDCGADKDEALDKYKGSGCLWIEDKPENADLGFDLGLDALIMDHEHNKDYDGFATRVYNWKQIYNYIVGQ